MRGMSERATIRPMTSARSLRRDRRVALGSAAAFVAGACLVRRPEVTRTEQRWFHLVNRLPASVHGPAWAVMQLGSLGGVVAAAVVAARAERPELARRVATVGAGTWAGAKVLKRVVGRGRPNGVLADTRILGREQTGLGYPSGHAAVAAALCAVAAPALPPRWRTPAWVWAALVGPIRMYVGAHLPLDVAGGVALGVAAGASSRLLVSAAAHPPRAPIRRHPLRSTRRRDGGQPQQ
jgi:glycosyltransferase 2 family protein